MNIEVQKIVSRETIKYVDKLCVVCISCIKMIIIY